MIDEAYQQVEECRRRERAEPDRHLEELGAALFQLSALLTGVPDRFPELDGVLAEAVEVYRRLVRARKPEGLPGLALALDQRARLMGISGRPAEARELAVEAVGHFRRLADDDPDAALALLATALSNSVTTSRNSACTTKRWSGSARP